MAGDGGELLRCASSFREHCDSRAPQVMKVQVGDASGNRCFGPELGEISLAKRLPGPARQDSRRYARHAVQHPLQCCRDGYLDQEASNAPPLRLALSEPNEGPVIRRPHEPEEVTLALASMQREDKRPLYFQRRDGHKGCDMLVRPAQVGTVGMVTMLDAAQVIDRHCLVVLDGP